VVTALQAPIAANSLKLPASRRLDALADFKPVVAVDSREQDPLQFTRLESRVVSLPTGDYGLLGCPNAVAIERKSIPDLVAVCQHRPGPIRTRVDADAGLSVSPIGYCWEPRRDRSAALPLKDVAESSFA
jgi:hypothetical protein